MFYQMQDDIALFLLINFIIFVVLSIKQNNIFKFLVNIFSANVIIGLFSVFAFEQECFRIFAYFTFVLCIAYTLSVFALMILSDKFKTDRFDELKRINDKSRMFQFFITVSLLNIASVPVLSFFGAELICFMMIFATDYDGVVLNIAPYVLIIGAFALSAGVFNALYRILIEPPEKSINITTLASHQVIVFGSLVFLVVILSFCPNYIFDQIGTVMNIGNF
jgi:NADH:ubiquinone oxidoreductase subunit 4 (subunit M)